MVVIIILKLDSFRCHRIGSLHIYKKNTVRRLKGLLLLFLHYLHASHIELVNLFLSSHTNQIISNQILFLLPPLSIGSISKHSCYSPDLHEICYQHLHLAHNTQLELHNLVTDTFCSSFGLGCSGCVAVAVCPEQRYRIIHFLIFLRSNSVAWTCVFQ